MNPAPEAPVPVARPPWLRLCLTLLLPLCAYAAQHVPLPQIDVDALRAPPFDAQAVDLSSFSIVALGLAPVTAAFFLVELAARLFPRLRPLRRGDLAGRQALRRAALWLTVPLALFQSYSIARWLLYSADVPGLGGALRVAGPGFVPLTMLTLTAGTMALYWLGRVIGGRALGAGFSVLIAGLGAVRLCQTLVAPAAQRALAAREPLAILLGGLLVLATAAAVTLVLVRPVPARRGPPVRLPASGLLPLPSAASLLMLPVTIAGLAAGPAPAWLAALAPGTAAHALLSAVLIVAGAVLCTWLFSAPDAKEARDPAALRSALGSSVALLLGLFVLQQLTARALGFALDVIALTALPAVALDLLAEWRLRRAHGALTHVWTCPHLPAASAALVRLHAAGVPAVVRGLHHRSLWHFVAPYLELDVLVPAVQADAAQAVLTAPEAGADAGAGALPAAPGAARSVVVFVCVALLVVAVAVGAVRMARDALQVFSQRTRALAPRLVYRVELDDAARAAGLSAAQAQAADVQVLRARLARLDVSGEVSGEGDRIVVALRPLPPARRTELAVQLARRAQLSLRLIDDGAAYTQQLAAYLRAHADAHPEVAVAQDTWSGSDGTPHDDLFLRSPGREPLTRFLAALPPALAPPPGRRVLLAARHRNPDGAAPPGYRTHVVDDTPVVTERSIQEAELMFDPSGLPLIGVTLDAAGAARLAAATGNSVGRRLAIVLDDTVLSAPVVGGAITGGRVQISLGGDGGPQAEQAARDLVELLREGGLAAPLVLVDEGPAPVRPSP